MGQDASTKCRILLFTKGWLVALVTSTTSLESVATDSCTCAPISLLGFELVDGHIMGTSGVLLATVSGRFHDPTDGSWNLTVCVWCGRHVESLVDHAAYMVLVRRELLAYFSSVYVFVRESHNKRQHLWTSVIEDLGTAPHGHLGHW